MSLPVCKICGYETICSLAKHIIIFHKLNLDEYPYEIFSEEYKTQMCIAQKKRVIRDGCLTHRLTTEQRAKRNFSISKNMKMNPEKTSLRAKYAGTFRKFSNEWKEKQRVISKRRWDNFSSDEKVAEVKKTILSKRNMTCYEKNFLNLINKNKLPIKYIGDCSSQINGKIPDFIWEEKKIIIEVFYKYFKEKMYGSISNYKKIRKKELHGYKIFFIKENIGCEKLINYLVRINAEI